MNESTVQVKVQKFGRFLSAMVMPNIGAFITWGLITALFIDVGWLPNATFATFVTPMMKWLLPLLLGYTGGRLIGGVRGGVVGATATFGIIFGTEIAMFSGAMIMGPLGGFVIKKIDAFLEGKIPSGFEMLINNFTAGISGMLLSMLGFVLFGPLVTNASAAVGNATQAVIDAGLLPLTSIIIEPAKILFLNNTLNWGIFAPLGAVEALDTGKSIFFLLETNPGPGLGILLAYWMFAKGIAKQTAPGAVIIHFLGGIHEIYFPYVLMQPLLIIGAIAGGMSGVFMNVLLNNGLVAGPTPGSIFALLAMSTRDGILKTLISVVVAAGVSFVISSVIIKKTAKEDEDDDEFNEAKEKMVSLKGKKSNVEKKQLLKSSVSKIIVACDAGMGSSAMGASKLRNLVKAAGLDIEVTNQAIDNIPNDADIVITHSKLTSRAVSKIPNAEHISIENFMNNTQYGDLVDRLLAEVK
ncbi:MAG: PTS mannitol transporter subunit IIBC [Firmicutes bacterium HGW-Firmicutes-1]|jgi:PTS system mannitol-specific IIC component|nr:MAG: PTS mannitol transporter subunit IIBC [Firmicutes bacterium HGW-Firmicutes-1]